jgi:hypothetical protein
MFGWLRRLFRTRAVPPAVVAAARPFRWPDEVRQLSSWVEVEATLRQDRAIVFIWVSWAIQAHRSRRTFAEFVQLIAQEHPALGVHFGVVTEYSEGLDRWWKALSLPASAAGGFGPVVWLQQGHTVGLVPYAAEAGTAELVRRTLQLWGSAEQHTPADC